jgi:hypothetical protein
MMLFILAILVGVLHVGYTVYQKSVSRGGDPIYSVLAESLLWFAFLVLFVAVWKFYCKEWSRLSDQSVLRVVAERIWAPLIAVFLITEPQYYLPGKTVIGVVVSGLALFVVLMDWGGSIRNTVERVFTGIHVMDNRILYSNFPPRKRSDLFPMDAIVNVATIIMILKKLT